MLGSALVHKEGIEKKKKGITPCNTKDLFKSLLFTQKNNYYQMAVLQQVVLPHLLSEEHVRVFNEHLHHLSLMADVIECCHGVQVWRSH